MSTSPNKLWALGPFVAVILLAAAYYIKVPAFRDAVNARSPWVKEHLSKFVPAPEVVIIHDPKPISAPRADGLAATPTAPGGNGPVPTVPLAGPASLTLQTFAADRSLWPKTVRLRTPTEFPAYLNGKKIGKIEAPAGTEAHLVAVSGEQLGVEFQGTGAWVPISQTDLTERVKLAIR